AAHGPELDLPWFSRLSFGGCELLSIRVEGNAGDRFTVLPEDETFLSAARVPDSYGAIAARRSQLETIRAEGDSGDFATVTMQSADFPAGGEVPEFDCSVGGARR